MTRTRVRTVISHCRTQTARPLLTLGVRHSADSGEAAGSLPTSLATDAIVPALTAMLPDKRGPDRQRARLHRDRVL